MKVIKSINKLASLLIIVAIGLLIFLSSIPSFADDDIAIQLKWFHQFQFAGYYAAIEKGYFADEGLNVSLRELDPLSNYIDNVVSGKAEYGVADGGLLLSHLEGKPVVLLSQIFQHSPLVLLTLRDSGIKTPYDLNEKKIMIELKGNSCAPLNAMLKKTLGKISLVDIIPNSYKNTDLLEGKIDAMDAYFTDQPYWFDQKNKPVRVLDPRDYGIDFYGDNLFTSKKEIIENPERVEKVIRAVEKGWLYAIENPEEIVNLILKKYNTRNLSRDHLLFEAVQIKNVILPNYIQLGSYEPSRYTKMIETYSFLGLSEYSEIDSSFFYSTKSEPNEVDQISLTKVEKIWLSNNSKIRIGVDAFYAPYSFRDDQGNYVGIAMEFMEYLSKRLGIEIEIIDNLTWPQIVEGVKEKNLDVVLTMSYRSEREDFVNFTDIYLPTPLVIMKRNDNADINSESDLEGKTVALVEGYSASKTIVQEHPTVQQLIVKTAGEALFAVATGKADAYVGVLGINLYLLKEKGITNLEIASVYGEATNGQRLAVRKDWPHLAAILQKALNNMPEVKKQSIFSNWLPSMASGLTLVEKIKKVNLTEKEKLWIQNNSVIKVHNEMGWPPYNYNEGGEPQGYSIDFMNLIAEKSGLKVEYVSGPTWNEFLNKIKNNELDVMLNIAKNKEREQYLEFTSPYTSLSERIVYRIDNGPYNHISDLNKKKVAVVEGFFNISFLSENYPEIKLVKFPDVLEAMLSVARGKTEAMLGEFAVMNYMFNEYQIINLTQSPPLGKKEIPTSDLHIGVRKDFKILAGILDKAIADITLQERLTLQDRWFGTEKKSFNNLVLPEIKDFNQTNFIIRYIAAMFAAIMIILLIIWFRKGRPRQLNIKETLFIISFILTGLIVSIATFVTMLLEGEKLQSEIEADKYKEYNLAIELKQSSDDLTRFARTFAATGDAKYEQYFQLIIDIRDGKLPHPKEFSNSYWDFLNAGILSFNIDGETYSIQNRMINLGLSKAEQEKLTEAKLLSDKLIDLELIAFNAIKGIYKNENGLFNVIGKPDRDYALQILYGDEYHQAKAKILKPIDEFFMLLEWRTATELNQVREQNQAIILGITILTLITIGFSIYMFFLFKRRIITPLHLLETGANKLKKGNYDYNIGISTCDEVGALANAFRSMAISIKERTSQIQDQKEFLETTLNSLAHPFYVIDANNYSVILMNDSAKKIAATNVTTCHEMTHETPIPCNANNEPCPLVKIKKTKAPVKFEHIHYDHEGNEKTVEIHGYPILDKNGNVIQIIEYSLDITERINAEKDILKAKEEAETATKAKSDFLANMSHEIRTPMNAIIGLNSLMENTKLTLKQKDYSTKIGRAAKNLLGIINDILDFSKIEAGKLAIEEIEFDLDDVLDNISNVLGLKAYNKGIEFLIVKEKGVPENLIGDPLRLGQILINLTNNSIKFTEKGEVNISIKIKENRNNNILLQFTITDTGIGMTEEQIEKLFKAFSQADTSITRKFGGTGLGLTISKQLVKLMHGAIGVESVYGKGSTFYFTAKFEKGKEAKKITEIIPEPLKNLKILVVEDNKSAGEVMTDYLERFSYKPKLIASGSDVIKEAQNNKYDLIFINYKLADMNGIEAWVKIKTILDADELPKSVLITAYGKEEIIKLAKKEGFSSSITKPIQSSMLFNSIITTFGESIEYKEDKKSFNIYPEGFDKIRGAKLLLVEDNDINQQVAKETLELEGFWVEIADNGQIAINKILENPEEFEFVFMDLQMPVLDGYSASRKLRKEHNITNLPIIALSADAMTGTKQRVLDAGMNNLITKPINKKDMFEVLAKWIKPKDRNINSVELIDSGLISKEKLAQVLSNIDVFDGLKRVSENMDLYIKVLRKFKKSGRNFKFEISEIVNHRNTEESVRIAHTLCGVAGTIGAKNLYFHAKQLESRLESNNSDNLQLKEHIDRLNDELTTVIDQIEIVLSEVEFGIDNNSEPEVEIKKDELLEKLINVKGLIEVYNTKASEVYDELVKYMNSFGVLDKYKKMGECIEDYAFDEALKLCNEIIETVGA